MRIEDLGEPIQKVIRGLQRDVSEEELELLKNVGVKQMARVYEDLENGVDAENILNRLKENSQEDDKVHMVKHGVQLAGKQPRSPKKGDLQGGAGVMVSNLPDGVSESNVSDVFAMCGDIASISLQPASTGDGQQAIVMYNDASCVPAAIQLSGMVLGAKSIQVTDLAAASATGGVINVPAEASNDDGYISVAAEMAPPPPPEGATEGATNVTNSFVDPTSGATIAATAVMEPEVADRSAGGLQIQQPPPEAQPSPPQYPPPTEGLQVQQPPPEPEGGLQISPPPASEGLQVSQPPPESSGLEIQHPPPPQEGLQIQQPPADMTQPPTDTQQAPAPYPPPVQQPPPPAFPIPPPQGQQAAPPTEGLQIQQPPPEPQLDATVQSTGAPPTTNSAPRDIYRDSLDDINFRDSGNYGDIAPPQAPPADNAQRMAALSAEPPPEFFGTDTAPPASPPGQQPAPPQPQYPPPQEDTFREYQQAPDKNAAPLPPQPQQPLPPVSQPPPPVSTTTTAPPISDDRLTALAGEPPPEFFQSGTAPPPGPSRSEAEAVEQARQAAVYQQQHPPQQPQYPQHQQPAPYPDPNVGPPPGASEGLQVQSGGLTVTQGKGVGFISKVSLAAHNAKHKAEKKGWFGRK
eukprot:TRINITY_DN67204_c3_g1_i1.p1 TRINITY_DN67204_c3_g1~~TRINITY_DN67204_c3_g1_i1.p1  ORF type:complete len:633 (-),score=150.54 TRINITY_DN67204_c3_g1_i1:646-2544(-)